MAEQEILIKKFQELKKRIVGLDKLIKNGEKVKRDSQDKIKKLEEENEAISQQLEMEKEQRMESVAETEKYRQTLVVKDRIIVELEKAKADLIEAKQIDEKAKAELIEAKQHEIMRNNQMETSLWQCKSQNEKFKQEKAGQAADLEIQKFAMTKLKQQNTQNEKRIKSYAKKLKEYETLENDKDEIINNGLKRDKKLQMTLVENKKLSDENKKLLREIQELKKNENVVKLDVSEVVELDVSDDEVVQGPSGSQHEHPLQIKSDLPAHKKRANRPIFKFFSAIKMNKQKNKTVRRKIPFLQLKKITAVAENIPEATQVPPPRRVTGSNDTREIDIDTPIFDLFGNRYYVPSYDDEANIIIVGKVEPDAQLVVPNFKMSPQTIQGSKRKMNPEATPILGKKLKLATARAEVHPEVELPKEISPIKSPGKKSCFSKGVNSPKTPKDTSMPCRALASSTPMEKSSQSPKATKKPSTPKVNKNTEDEIVSPKILSPNMSSAKMRLVSNINLNPMAIEPIKPGTKLTAAQIEAAKQRMVGRAAPGVTSRPSVDGFRASEPIIKHDKSKASEDSAHFRMRGIRTRNKASNIEDLEPCPTRKSTQPCKMNTVVKDDKESEAAAPGETSVGPDRDVPDVEAESSDTPTQKDCGRSGSQVSRQRRLPPDHQLPRQQSVPVGNVAEERLDSDIVIVHLSQSPLKTKHEFRKEDIVKENSDISGEVPKVNKINENVDNSPKMKGNGKIVEDDSLSGKATESIVVTKSSEASENTVTDADMASETIVTEPNNDTQNGEISQQNSVESLEDDLNLSDSYDEVPDSQEDINEDVNVSIEVSLKSTEIQEDMESDDDDDKPVNRRKRKRSQTEDDVFESLAEPISIVERLGVGNEQMLLNVVSEKRPEVEIAQKQNAAQIPTHFLGQLLHNYQARHDQNVEKLQSMKDKLAKERVSFAREAFVQCLRKNFANYNGTQNHVSFAKIVDGISTGSTDSDEEAICDLVFEELKSQPTSEPTLDQDGNGPPITRLEKRLFVLLDALRKKERFSGILDRMACLLYHGLFARDHMYSLKLAAVCSFGRMFVLCMRRLYNLDRVRQFMLDCLFFKSPRNHLLIGICTSLFPQVFNHWQSAERHNPQEKTVAWMFFNTGVNAHEMRANEIKHNFRKSYGYPFTMGVRAEDLVKEFITMAQEKATQPRRLDQLRQCLLLIGRTQPYSWVHNNIVKRLFTVLQNINKEQKMLGVEEKERIRIWVTKTLGTVSRLFTVEEGNKDRALMTDHFEAIEKLLMLTKGSSQEMENISICCLTDHSHHLQHQFAKFCTTWKPKHPLYPSTIRKLEDFVGTRGRKHAEITCRFLEKQIHREKKRKIRQQIKAKMTVAESENKQAPS